MLVAVALGVVAVPVGDAAPVDGWDPRVAPIAHKVERLRHLKFLRPVPARFLTPAKFRKRVTTDEADLDRSDRRNLAVHEAELRSLGLVAGDFDLLATVNDEAGSGIVAYYDDRKEEMVIRGKRIDPEAKVTIAHELTHALQDQHYDLGTLTDHTRTDGADDALTALVEGDATVVEDGYYWALSRADRRKVDRAEEAAFGTEPDSGATPDAPDIVAATMDAPYALGPWMVRTVQDARGRRGLAAEFRSPPKTQLDYLLPTEALKTRPPRRLGAPKVPDGARRLQPKEPTDFGALDLYLMLASRIPFPNALQAADGWGNGREVLSRKDGTVCADVRLVGRQADATHAIGRALKAWGAAVTPTPVEVDAVHDSFHVCDPGDTATAPVPSAEDALAFAAARNELLSELVSGDFPPAIAGCIGHAIVAEPVMAELVASIASGDDPTKAAIKRIQRTVERLIDPCVARSA